MSGLYEAFLSSGSLAQGSWQLLLLLVLGLIWAAMFLWLRRAGRIKLSQITVVLGFIFICIVVVFLNVKLYALSGLLFPLILYWIEKMGLIEGLFKPRQEVYLLLKSYTGYTAEFRQHFTKFFNQEFSDLRLMMQSENKREENPNLLAQLKEANKRETLAIVLVPPAENSHLTDEAFAAINGGIPVVTVDDTLDRNRFHKERVLPPVHIRPSFSEGGRKAAKALLKKLKRDGRSNVNVAIIAGPWESVPCQKRRRAFIEAILEESPEIRPVAIKYTGWQPREGKQMFCEILKDCERVEAVFCCNDRLARGVSEAIRDRDHQRKNPDLSHSDTIVIGFDGISTIRPLIIEGHIFATVDVDIMEQAKLAVQEIRSIRQARRRYLTEHDLEKIVKPRVITKEDIVCRDSRDLS